MFPALGHLWHVFPYLESVACVASVNGPQSPSTFFFYPLLHLLHRLWNWGLLRFESIYCACLQLTNVRSALSSDVSPQRSKGQEQDEDSVKEKKFKKEKKEKKGKIKKSRKTVACSIPMTHLEHRLRDLISPQHKP